MSVVKTMVLILNPSTDYTEKIGVICGWAFPFHEGRPHNWHDLVRAWSFEPLVVVSLTITALLFWWALIHGPQGALGYGAAVLYLFTTSVHSGVLGALITLAGSVWYPSYVGLTSSWGLTPLEDQQLGGLIMWIPAGLVYVIAGLALFAGWLREADVRAGKRERLELAP